MSAQLHSTPLVKSDRGLLLNLNLCPMESTLIASTSTTLALRNVTKALNRRLSNTFLSRPLASRYVARRLTGNYGGFQTPFSSSTLRRSLCVVDPPTRRRLECVASNHASFASGGGNGGFGGESGGSGGDDGGSSDGGDSKSKVVASGGDEVSAVVTDVIILDVGVRNAFIPLSLSLSDMKLLNLFVFY